MMRHHAMRHAATWHPPGRKTLPSPVCRRCTRSECSVPRVLQGEPSPRRFTLMPMNMRLPDPCRVACSRLTAHAASPACSGCKCAALPRHVACCSCHVLMVLGSAILPCCAAALQLPLYSCQVELLSALISCHSCPQEYTLLLLPVVTCTAAAVSNRPQNSAYEHPTLCCYVLPSLHRYPMLRPTLQLPVLPPPCSCSVVLLPHPV
jgi:hypothetical protein